MKQHQERCVRVCTSVERCMHGVFMGRPSWCTLMSPTQTHTAFCSVHNQSCRVNVACPLCIRRAHLVCRLYTFSLSLWHYHLLTSLFVFIFYSLLILGLNWRGSRLYRSWEEVELATLGHVCALGVCYGKICYLAGRWLYGHMALSAIR